ncbi:MAG TPA: 50S ribosomal protein L11 methyltransferase [Bryobacteraceae bacterium]|nr:50S ribosomal protein L11 methyltransferase [Bryobacteraceae bacterium]
MFSLILHAAPHEEDYVIAELADFGVLGITEEVGALRAFFDDIADRRVLLQRFGQYRPRIEPAEDTDWAQVSRDAWPPIMVGQRFYLVPPWAQDATPPGRLRLEIEPGMACGTGRHPATQLCLEALEKYVRPGCPVLDVGTGSGILAQAALLLGAGRVVGCDVDTDAIAVARARVDVPLFVGSADAVQSCSQDLIVANIDSATVELLGPEFARVRRPASTLILSGFPQADLPKGFSAKQMYQREEWVCLIC